jgi:hypothetical protein
MKSLEFWWKKLENFQTQFQGLLDYKPFFPGFLFSKDIIPLYFEVFCQLLVLGYLGQEGG